MKVLVTGGLGFIGSHTTHMLLKRGYKVLILDNLSNSRLETLDGINSSCENKAQFVEGDILDRRLLDQIFTSYDVQGVIHFAALKSVKESMEKPERYHLNNVEGTERLLGKCIQHGVERFVFSSSAAVYGNSSSPVSEDAEIGEILNPYGGSKIKCEQILRNTYSLHGKPDITILRYFNVAGAHPEGILGEEMRTDDGNLMSHIIRIATGEIEKLFIYGGDYDTPDGTGIRDYIHVMDVARGHIHALEKQKRGVHIYNLGSGKGTSVLQILQSFEKVNGRRIAYEIVERREGDIGVSFADPSKAMEELGWWAELDIRDIVRDSWDYQWRLIQDMCK